MVVDIPPDVDVVVPTLNCANALTACLRCVKSQSYGGTVRVIVVDGGSTDQTQAVAEDYGTELLVLPKVYSDGLTGAKQRGFERGHAPLVWFLDSDNEIPERTGLSSLSRPLLTDPKVNFSFPMPAVNPGSTSFNRWLSLREIEQVRSHSAGGRRIGNWIYLDPTTYGLTNATLIRREILSRVSGYDVDVRVLERLAQLGEARGALVEDVHLYHNEAPSFVELLRKVERRIRKYGSMTDSQRREYFVEFPTESGHTLAKLQTSILYSPVESVKHLLAGDESAWGWGLTFPVLAVLAATMHPVFAYKVYANWF